jgi:hypothetical protein
MDKTGLLCLAGCVDCSFCRLDMAMCICRSFRIARGLPAKSRKDHTCISHHVSHCGIGL